jgi:hypothetical protein
LENAANMSLFVLAAPEIRLDEKMLAGISNAKKSLQIVPVPRPDDSGDGLVPACLRRKQIEVNWQI